MKFITMLSAAHFINSDNEVIDFTSDNEIASSKRINNKTVNHPIYEKINSMNRRIRNQSEYSNVTMHPIFDLKNKHSVTDRILYLYSHLIYFREWLSLQMDKDILLYNLYTGNRRTKEEMKIYDISFMIPVTRKLNSLFTDRKEARGELPLGCCENSDGSRIVAQCNNGNGKQNQKHFNIKKHGYNNAIALSHFHYLFMKRKQIQNAIMEYNNESDYINHYVKLSLYHRMQFIDYCLYYGLEILSIQNMIFKWNEMEYEWWF